MDYLPHAILLLPLAAAAAIFLGVRRSPGASALLATASALVTLVLAFLMKGQADATATLLEWIPAGDITLDIGFKIDAHSKGMMIVVTLVGSLVHLFSLGYMKDDPGKARYFAGLALFMFSMTGIVLADNFAMMFVFWELVGVSSYLLIGHWFQKNSAAEAAKKAFLVNRIGDFGFMAGILLLWGVVGSVNFDDLENSLPALAESHAGLLTAAALCIFCGAVGKSAQFPLHVWLPDAMEGPTPVSALIHAATMVAAGVYMLVRVAFLIGLSVCAQDVIAWIGGITALLAALMATQQDDIKRVLAYSTLSQLGYMVMAVGLAAGDAAMYHLFTHAFFKALLFLGSGAVIYACHHEQDIWKMGGLLKKMPITAATFGIGTLALMAVPPTSGFVSKEFILHAAHAHNHALFWIAAFVAFLTPFYMMRLFAVAFLGKPRDHGSEHAHEVPPIMWVPLAILAVPSLLAGAGFVAEALGAAKPEAHGEGGAFVMAVSIGAALAGIALGFLLYRGRDKEPLKISLFARKFYFDEIYLGIVRYVQDSLAYLAKALDQILVDGVGVRGATKLASSAGDLLRRLQFGNLQGYAFLFGLGVIALIYLALYKSLWEAGH